MENIILILVLSGLLGGAGYYLYQAKRKGQTCIGCPYAKTCHSRTGCGGTKVQPDAERKARGRGKG